MMFKPKEKTTFTGLRVGVAITPNTLSCCVLSADYQLIGHASQALKKGCVDIAKGPLSSTALEKSLKETLKTAGVSPSAYADCQVTLAIMPPLFSNIRIEPSKKLEDSLKLMTDKIREKKILTEKAPLILYDWLGNTPTEDVFLCASMDKMTLRTYMKVFNHLELTVVGVDTLPTSILRGLAGSGVLDVMLTQLGNNVPWGFLGIYDNAAWLMQWQGKQPVLAAQLELPDKAEAFEKTLHELIAYSGFNPPAIWLTWKDENCTSLITPETPALRAPQSTCQVGPFFASHDKKETSSTTPIEALGAALHDSVHFPFDWNFLSLAPDMSSVWTTTTVALD